MFKCGDGSHPALPFFYLGPNINSFQGSSEAFIKRASAKFLAPAGCPRPRMETGIFRIIQSFLGQALLGQYFL